MSSNDSRRADHDRDVRVECRHRRLEIAQCRFVDEHGLDAIPAILDHAPDDMPPFGDEQAARSQQVAVTHRAKSGDAWVATRARSRWPCRSVSLFLQLLHRAAIEPRRHPCGRFGDGVRGGGDNRRADRRVARVHPVERVGGLVVNVLVPGVVGVQIERRNPRQDERRAVGLKGIAEAVVERGGTEFPQEISASAAGRRGSRLPARARSSR